MSIVPSKKAFFQVQKILSFVKSDYKYQA